MAFDARSITGLIAVAVLAQHTPAFSQEAKTEQPPVEAAPAPAPDGSSTTLPTMEVITAPEPAVKAAPTKKQMAKKSSAPAPAPTPVVTPPAMPPMAEPVEGGMQAETATSPVKGYVANQTATGTKTDTPLREVPQSISVVGAEQIRDQGAQSIQDTLRYVPGVVADAYGHDSRTDSAFIRGTESAEYLDGLRRSFSYYTFNYRVDPFFMERVEVLRGPASVLYGQAPVGGIINSVTKRPQNEHGGEIGVEYGTFDFKQVKFDMTGPITSDGKWSYRLAGLARDADTQVNYVEDDRYAIAPSITYRPTSDTSITFLGHLQRDETGSSSQFYPFAGTLFPNVNGRRIPRENFAGEPGDHYDTDVASGTLLFEHRFSSAFKLSHASRYADIHNDYNSTYVDFYTGYTDAAQETVNRFGWRAVTNTQIFNQDTNLEAKFATGMLTHKVLGGIDYANFRASQGTAFATDSGGFNVYNPVYGQGSWAGTGCAGPYSGATTANLDICSYANQKITQAGLYIQDQMRLGNWIGIVGMRKDWVENDSEGSPVQKDEAVTYRAGLMYEFASGFTPYFSYGESFVPVAGFAGPGDPYDPQEGRMYELGFKYQPPGAQWMINSAIYDIADNNRVVYHDPLHYGRQIGAVSVKGFEIEFTGRITENLKIVTGYSYTDARYDDGTEVDGNQLESVPKHLASIWGVWEFDQPYLRGWSVGAGARYIGESWDDHHTIEVPDVALFDAMIAYEEDNWRWSINAKNLADEEYVSTCLNRGDCWYGSARTITTGLTYKF